MIGPNYALFYLDRIHFKENSGLKCKKSVKETSENDNKFAECEFIKDEKTKIVYYFETIFEETMYPKKIDVYKRKTSDDKWDHYREIEYVNFKPDVYKLDFKSLPVGLGCVRQHKDKYPQLTPFKAFRPDFKFSYLINLTYIDQTTKKFVTRRHLSTMYAATSEFNSYKWKLAMHINDGRNEETSKELRTFYDRSIQLYYDLYLEKDGSSECLRHSYHDHDNINWYYFQDLLIKYPNVFDISYSTYSYLGSYSILGDQALAFEMVLTGLNDVKEKNELNFDNDNHSKNLNKISSDYVIATYYYWNEDELKIPYHIEFRFKGDDKKTEIGILTVTIGIYYSYFKEHNAFDYFKYCIKKSKGYDLITIEYSTFASVLKKPVNEEKIKQVVREKLNKFISPLR